MALLLPPVKSATVTAFAETEVTTMIAEIERGENHL